MKKVHITTLGCPKNMVDSEVLIGQLKNKGLQISKDADDADVIIINTCGFIEDAKKESIQAIFEATKLKEKDAAKKIIAAGCLTKRYHKELVREIPEIDAIFGTEEFSAILAELGLGHAAEENLHRFRTISAPSHYAYLKISEGCNHRCGFCAIPSIRGKHRSRTIESLTDEAQMLADQGVKELILISQDSSYYGQDIYNSRQIVNLLDKLERINGFRWIRVLYWFAHNFPIEVLDLISSSNKILPYFDIPIQHASDHILKLMHRSDTANSLRKLFIEIRARLPKAALRTSVIVGHPGESHDDFNLLLDFIREIEFDRLGSFVYSDEDGTASYNLPDKVRLNTMLGRQQELMEMQRNISLRRNTKLIGESIEVLIDEMLENKMTFSGRTYRDAPEIDNEVIIDVASQTRQASIGQFVLTKITDASEYELSGKIIYEI
jgi:ribosomal protein S12 methylthiotransferase